MKINSGHLTYCTNIHPGESWDQVFRSLQKNVPDIKQSVSPSKPFGLGLRLSNQASLELIDQGLASFKDWLAQEDVYIFTMNGFPYGGFHRQKVKDQVHQPDWTTNERLDYTLRLFKILSQILPEGQIGGISTSPLSYKPWLSEKNVPEAFEKSTENIVNVVMALHRYRERDRVHMHLDIEPEPDGLLENSSETVAFFEEWLLPMGVARLTQSLGVSAEEAAGIIRQHVQVCYDVCHFAVSYEDQKVAMEAFQTAHISIGKIQISAALKKEFPEDNERSAYYQAFSSLNEPTYLHQVVSRHDDDSLESFRDLPEALESFNNPQIREWRTHFHVPVFVDSYGVLEATQADIVEVLELWKQHPMTAHLEVETYTWEVLPTELQLEITDSIVREMQWVLQQIKTEDV